MKIVIVGAGVIGTTYAWQLSQAGEDVTLLVRKGTTARIEQDGMLVHCLDLREKPARQVETVYHPKLTEEITAADDYELIIVAVKRHQLSSVLPLLQQDRIGKADILFFLNYWSGEEIERALPPSRYLFGFPLMVGGGREGQTINCTIFGDSMQGTLLGEKDGLRTPRLARIAAVFEAARLHPMLQDDILGWLQTHYVQWLGPVGEILKAGSVKGFARHPSLVKESIVATREGLEVCRARGVDAKKFAPVNRNYLPLFLTVPVACLQYRMKIIQDFLEAAIGQETSELARQYDDVLQEAERLGVKTPTLKALRPYVVQYAARAGQDQSSKISVHS